MTAAHTPDPTPDTGGRIAVAGVAVPPPKRRAPIWDGPVLRTDLCASAPLVWLLGAQGGAAVSTLTASLAWAGDSGRAWPSGGHGDSPLVVVVARTNLRGLRAAHDRAMEHRAALTPEAVRLLGLILVADTDRRPSTDLAREITRVSTAFEHIWRIGWVEPWRHMLPEDLPSWSPTSELPTDRRAAADVRRVPVAPVRELHDGLMAAAATALRPKGSQRRERHQP